LENVLSESISIWRNFQDYLLQSIIGRSALELLPEKSEQIQKEDQEIIETGEPKLNIHECYSTPKGKRWVLKNKIPYRDIGRKYKGDNRLVLDITERKQLEEQLLQSEKLLQ